MSIICECEQVTTLNTQPLTRYTHVHRVPHAEHMESSKRRSSKRCRDDGVLSSAYPVHGSASEVIAWVLKCKSSPAAVILSFILSLSS